MSTCGAATFVKFFTDAGISSPMSATYAHIFVENRMQMDMLVDLNKEYLKEMGIHPMGDIISILRHSKSVTDQKARERILSINEPKVISVAKILPASSVSSTVASIAVTPARRVLPEHEGKYKISLPKGSTKRSREILAKHSMMQADKMEKKSIFERLTKSTTDEDMEMADSTSNEPLIKIVKATSSIFNRLGNKKGLERKLEDKSIAFSGILKSSPIKQQPRGIVKHKISPKVILTKRTVAKNRMDTDESDSDSDKNMDSDTYKQVSFSPDVEVLEIAPHRHLSPKKLNQLKGMKMDGIKSRLGMKRNSVDSVLHATRKTISMKPSKTSPVSARASKMKSDHMQRKVPLQSRIDLKNRSSTNQLTNRIRNFKMDPNASKVPSSTNVSVFNRLGKNK